MGNFFFYAMTILIWGFDLAGNQIPARDRLTDIFCRLPVCSGGADSPGLVPAD